MVLLYFFIGGIYTVILLAVGMIIGYLMGTKKISEKIEILKNKLNKNKIPEGGAVKAITPAEKEEEKSKSFTNRLQSLISDNEP